ncbi:MAG: tRNA pseudouridine(38-40) synthase TruA [Candidatus Cloacimonetes bacterium 4572_55]|nr:MAG: tRNA pseudouridine(38-40) synthase TruA [Candidatus Cloacimonetes bacterium 4572_55]
MTVTDVSQIKKYRKRVENATILFKFYLSLAERDRLFYLSIESWKMMRNIKLIIEYEGTKFCGWQYQPNCRTVQGVIEDAILRLTHERTRITGSGRTDSGVHALEQVANFRIDSPHPIHVFRTGLNAWLPDDVKIIDAQEVDIYFNACRDARWRRYRYQVMRRFSPIHRRHALYVKGDLDVERMQKAVPIILDTLNFRSFCSPKTDSTNFYVQVIDCFWKQEGEMIIFEICANRFLYSMVRILVGSFLEIGKNKLSIHEMKEILTAQDRSKAPATAQAKGLFLVHVTY